MTAESPSASPTQDWRVVDEGWGRQAVPFATLSEPANCREYVALHQRLGVEEGDRLLDVACGAGLAMELAAARGATCAGIDASPRLIAVASDRLPDADIRVGDMQAMPWSDDSFDVVTSFRGIWGTTPGALTEVLRVLRPGGRVGMTVWGHIKASPGAWALKPFSLAAAPKVENQAAMVALGKPGVGEAFLADAGFVGIERFDIPFVWEFADPDAYARALASTGPAYEAIQAVGEEEFVRAATELARERVRDGLPLRAEIKVVGFLARKPITVAAGETDGGFLGSAEMTEEAQGLFDEDVANYGYVMNVSRLWAHQPSVETDLFALLGKVGAAAELSVRQRGILVTACASTLGDSYCALSWGNKLAGEAGAGVAGSVLRGDDEELDASEKALAVWARRVARDPNGTTSADLQGLRAAGFDDAQILAITAFVALRIAFSMVNDSLGAHPDWQIGQAAPEEVRSAVPYGRSIALPPD